jgi:DNA-binding response OmpR family regulator
VRNFVTAAVGIAVAVALIRGFSRRGAKTIGNFWVDLTRATIYVLLPIAFHFLAYLARHAGKVCTRRMILENVWDPGYRNELKVPEGLCLPDQAQAGRRARAVPAE